MTARELMSHPAVSVGLDTSIEDVARLLTDRGFGGVLVVDAQGQCEGMLTLSDLLYRVAHPHLPPHVDILGSVVYLATPSRMEELMGKIAGVVARDAMTREIVTAPPEMAVEDLADLMVEHKVGRIPILENGLPIGIVSRSDVIRKVLAGG